MSKPTDGNQSAARKILKACAVASPEDVPRERRHFRALVVANPNHFGNLAASAFSPVMAVKENSTYEEIKCLGFHPQSNRLDAVVFVKQPYGYGGDICSAGTPEYVRFFISLDNGATWEDQGLTTFTAYDVPAGATGGRHLEAAVSVECSPQKKWCNVPNVILARAILSWNAVPPADPNYSPVWGSIHTTHIQVDPAWRLRWVELFKLSDVKVTAALAESIDVEQAVTAAPKRALAVADLQDLYRGKGVEPHRYALAEVKRLIKTPALTALDDYHFQVAALDKIGLKLSDLVAKLIDADGSTVYEELDCVGLRSVGLSDELVGVLRIKRPNGYSGGPCTTGSREYVTFWADFDNNGTFETCLGTASVQVFDLSVPREGLEYSVNLPVDLNPYRRRCGEGPRVVPIRAILSWNEVPDWANPDWVPTWGNREETLVLVPPGTPVGVGDYTPFLYEISGAAVCAIDPGTGLAAGDRPFGATLCITGEIPGALSVAVPDTLEYRLWATQGATTIPIVSPFSLTVHTGTGPGTAVSGTISQSAGAGGYFKYREYGTPALGAWRRVSSPNRLLGYWNTAGLSGTWTIHVEARVAGTLAPIFAAGVTTCPDGTTRSSVNVTLDQGRPTASIDITEFIDATGASHPAVRCGDFTKGVIVKGTFDITDNMGLAGASFVLEPNLDPPASPVPVNVAVDAASTPTHRFGTWTVATASLPPCGYVVHLSVSDRAIVNCNGGWRDDAAVGFCLRSPE